MLEVRMEAVLFLQCRLYRRKQVFGAIYTLTAGAADQVVMMPFFGVVVDKMVPQFTFNHAAGSFKEFQSAVYR